MMINEEYFPRSLKSLLQGAPPPTLNKHITARDWNEKGGDGLPAWTKGMPKDVVNVILKHIDKKRMGFLNRGSSRVVFGVGGGKVLKVAVNAQGVAQNQAELEGYLKMKKTGFVAQVFKSDPEGRWLIMERVLPSDRMFDRFIELRWDHLMNTEIMDNMDDHPADLTDVLELSQEEWDNLTKLGVMSPTQRKFLQVLKDNSLLNMDSLSPDHWGLNRHNNLVMIDFGATENVLDRFYR